LFKIFGFAALWLGLCVFEAAAEPAPPRLLQQPAISQSLLAFTYAGDNWTVPRAGGQATRLTTGVGIERTPIFSPDGQTLAFTGDYDGNVDVFTVPVSGGVPHRVTYHPGADAAVAWSKDGRDLIFRSSRDAASRYTRFFTVPAAGGFPQPLPLPMAYDGKLSADGGKIAYNPLPPAFSFDFTSYVAWGNYHGGRAGAIWITDLKTLDSVKVPHEAAADFSPVFAGGKVYFLSGRNGPIGVFRYDPSTGAVAEVFHNTGPDIRSLYSDGQTLIFDRLGEIYTLTPGGAPTRVAITVAGDMPDVRPRLLNVADQVENIVISPTGVRAAVEAHGEILTVPVKHGAIRDLTNTPGVMERQPAWSPDGQKIAYFSDESGLYGLHVTSQTGTDVRKFKLKNDAAYYFKPIWSPDSLKIAFFDNRGRTYVLDTVTGKLSDVGAPDVYGGFSSEEHALAWSPDSRWLAYPHSADNHLHVLMLYNLASGTAMPLTNAMADARDPAFDGAGKYLYFLASNNSGATSDGLDMTSDLYRPTASVYAITLARSTASPVAPQSDDEKPPKDEAAAPDAKPADKASGKDAAKASPKPPAAPTAIDLAGLSVAQIAGRITALPLPAADYRDLASGKGGAIYVLRPGGDGEATFYGGDAPADLLRWTLEARKVETIASRVVDFQLTADGEKVLLAQAEPGPPTPGAPPKLAYLVAPADKPVKAGDGDALKLDGLEVRVDPAAEWAQMYHEVWRIERAFFYDPNFHGYDTQAEEARLAPYVAGLQSRADLNYVFQEMLTGFSIGHLRGFGGAIPAAPKVAGGLLGADYEARGGHYCLAKIYDGGSWSPAAKAPLAQPGLNVAVGDCILAINGEAVSGDEDIQKPLEGTSGHAILLTLAPAGGGPSRDITVVPIASEATLRNLDWIDSNQRKVAALSGGKLAYVYLPDTGQGGFTNFNRYYFAQTDKQGAIIDERFNAGGQVADYIIEVLGRRLEAYWQPRYGAVEHTPNAAIYGPKVMIANEVSGSGGDAMPWLFKYNKLGPLVGKRTWGGLVGIGPIPVLMDGGTVTSPSVGFFSPKGAWDVENHGVDPDEVVEMDPKAVAAGHDPQLEAAVALAMDALAKAPPPPTPTHPPFPIYGHGAGP